MPVPEAVANLPVPATTSIEPSPLIVFAFWSRQISPVTLTTTTSTGATQTTTFTPTTRALSAFEVNQALQLASTLLAQQGILNPTPDQLRVALLGGTLTTATGTTVAVQGVLQGALNTSSSPLAGTSNTPATMAGTSNTPAVGTTVTPPPAIAPAAEAPRTPPTVAGGARGSASSGATTTTGSRR